MLVDSETWVEIPIVVVVKVRLLIEVLPREAEVELERSERGWVLIGGIDAEGFLLVPPPDRLPRSIGNQTRRVEVIDVNVVTFTSLTDVKLHKARWTWTERPKLRGPSMQQYQLPPKSRGD